MVDLAYTKEELAAKEKEYGTGTAPADMPKYPYGLSMYLSDDVVEKIGGAPGEVGDTVQVSGTVKIVGRSEREEAGGDVCKTLDLQFTSIEFGKATKGMKEIASAIYPEDGE